jgi:hypothetical protein
VLVCIDGPETPGGAVLVEGPECPFDPRFVDTFTLRMVLRTMAVHVVE